MIRFFYVALIIFMQNKSTMVLLKMKLLIVLASEGGYISKVDIREMF